MLRILVADSHWILRKGVRNLIEAHAGWEVCGEAADGQEALEVARREAPDLAIIDVSLPILNGIALIRRLRQECPGTRVLVLTAQDGEETIRMALAAGARAYVLKTDVEEHLKSAISAMANDRPWFTSVASEMLLDDATGHRKRHPLESFTARELEVGQLIAEGNSSKQIAIRLGVTLKTIESHRSAAMRKASVSKGPEFVRFAIKHNLIQV